LIASRSATIITVLFNATGTSPAATGSITDTASVDLDNSFPKSNELKNTSALVNPQVTAGPLL
jgi:hypothetical protein